MKLGEIKKAMLLWCDYYGQDISDTAPIKKAKTKNELRDVLDKHIRFLELQNIDAMTHAEEFKKQLGLLP